MSTLPRRIRLNPLPVWQLRLLAWTTVALLATGLAWLVLLRTRGEDGLPGPAEPWLARCHALAAMLSLFAAGVVASVHVGRGWALGERRPTGVWIGALFALVALSGFGLSYLVPETWHAALGWTHSALGVAAFAVGLVHRR